MRILYLIGLLLAACGEDIPASTPADLAGVVEDGGDDLSVAGPTDLAGVDFSGVDFSGVDLAPAPGADFAGQDSGGGSADLGGAGAPCQTACDCMPGLGCFAGQCTAGVVPVYCCGSANCPGTNICQSATGAYGRCGGGGGFDLSMFDPCPLISCNGAMGTQRCMNAGCAQCIANPAGGGMICSR